MIIWNFCYPYFLILPTVNYYKPYTNAPDLCTLALRAEPALNRLVRPESDERKICVVITN